MEKAVVFDIDGVLVNSRVANRKFHQKLIELVGEKKVASEEIDPFFSYTLKEIIQYFYPKLTEEKLKKALVLGENLYPKFYPFVKFEKKARKVLKLLSKNYLLGVVTGRLNADILKHFKIRNYFKTVITFKDYSLPKPHPEPLLLALKNLNVKPENSVYIGDSELDQKAAKAVGVKFIAFKNPSLSSTYRAEKISQLPKIVEKIFKT